MISVRLFESFYPAASCLLPLHHKIAAAAPNIHIQDGMEVSWLPVPALETGKLLAVHIVVGVLFFLNSDAFLFLKSSFFTLKKFF